jgi:hypothetical protein
MEISEKLNNISMDCFFGGKFYRKSSFLPPNKKGVPVDVPLIQSNEYHKPS